ncbi:Thyroid adenoma-associated protein isoform X2 [Oopsacas minuta]|uniref:Thyroid adenoma-associated protein isoform X2 n=1 Tax=Oopsacas minuta TaxID=111878 RepID=A0AAV7JHN1_9METZ|nr:Thyroid adenoma-associated protein isoform X2 [Oopsacas minuta]
MTLNSLEEINRFEFKLQNSLDIELEEIQDCHKKLIANTYAFSESFISKLVTFYFNIPIKSPLKKAVRAILKDLILQHTFTPYISDVLITQVSSQSERMFSSVEDCLEHLPGGYKLVEEHVYFIFTEMNIFLSNNRTRLQPHLISIIKSYHKIIGKCRSAIFTSQEISLTSEYNYLNRVLANLTNNITNKTELTDLHASKLFGGIAQCADDDDVDISQTSIIVLIQLMRFLKQDTILNDLYKVNAINMSNHTPNVRILYGLISAAPIQFMFYQVSLHATPVCISILLEIEKLLIRINNKSLPCLQVYRCLHSCIISLRKAVITPSHKQMLKSSLMDEDIDLKQVIVDIVMNNWYSHIETIRHLIKEIFMDFLKLLSDIFEGETQTICENYAKSFLLLDVKSTTKYKYLCLLSNYIPLSRWIILDPLLPETLPMVMDECALATHVGEFWCRLVCQDSVLFSDIQPWIDAILCNMSRITPGHCHNIYDFCKKGIIACHADILQYIASQVPETGQGYLFLILCLKQAQKQQHNTDVTKILNRDKIKYCLISCSSELSISALDLICLNKKSNSIISEEDLQLVLKGFITLVDINSVSIRKNLISSLTALLLLIERSAHKHTQYINRSEDNATNHYSCFLDIFSSLLFALLNPTSSQGTNEIVLSILSSVLNLYQINPTIFPTDFQIKDFQLEILLASLKSTFEFHCNLSFKILILLKDRVRVWLSAADNSNKFVNDMYSLMLSPVSVHSTSASYYVRLLLRLYPEKLYSFIQEKWTNDREQLDIHLSQDVSDNSSNNINLNCLWSLLQLLNMQLEISKERWNPTKYCLYSIIRCIRGVLSECSIQETDISYLKQCLDTSIHLCTRVLSVTGHIVCNSSPEGYLSDYVDDDSTQLIYNRSVLLCSWQSLKEISLLFSEIIELFFPIYPSLFYPSNLTTIYRFYLNYLIEARHRGAFELTYVGFVKLCNCLWLSPTPSVFSLPSIWLQEVLSNLLNNEKRETQMNLLSCATRRSAGLPYLVLAILSNEPKHLNNKYLSITMDTLTTIAAKVVQSPEDIIIQVHSLNILRALFKDNKLRDIMHQYVSTTIPHVIRSVSSTHWPIRNASHLLFSSIMSRVFGVKRTQDEYAWQNKMTTHNFFSRYPTLWELFSNILTQFVEYSKILQPEYSVFLILTIFSRLYISKSDTNSHYITILIPQLFRLCENPCWKLRQMSANSISSLLSSQIFSLVYPYFLKNSPHSLENPSHNTVHGFLLVLKEVVQLQISKLSVTESVTLFNFCNDLIPVCTRCIVNQCTVFQILTTLIDKSQKCVFESVRDVDVKLYFHLVEFFKKIFDKSALKNDLFLQTRISTSLRLTIALSRIKDIFSNQSIMSLPHNLLDRSDLRQYSIQSILEMEMNIPPDIFPLNILFILFLESTNEERINIICIIMRNLHFNFTKITQELSQQKYSDLHTAFNMIHNLIVVCSVEYEYLTSLIQFAGCLILSLNIAGESISYEINTFIHSVYEIAITTQVLCVIQCIDYTLCAIYDLIIPSTLDEDTINKFWFLSLYGVHLCNDSKLASVITTVPRDKVIPVHVHPSVATEILLMNITILLNEERALRVLLFLLQNIINLELTNEVEENDTDRLFEESSVNYFTIPTAIILCISKLILNIVENSINSEVRLAEIQTLFYNIREQLELVHQTDGLAWNRKYFLLSLLYSLLYQILQERSIKLNNDILSQKSLFSSQAILEPSILKVILFDMI